MFCSVVSILARSEERALRIHSASLNIASHRFGSAQRLSASQIHSPPSLYRSSISSESSDVLNAFRHLRSIHTPTLKFTAIRCTSAQRLSASQIHSPLYLRQLPHCAWLRAQRLSASQIHSHGCERTREQVSLPMCSTPFGISDPFTNQFKSIGPQAGISAQRLSASQIHSRGQ